jgi:hypothetical protein
MRGGVGRKIIHAVLRSIKDLSIKTNELIKKDVKARLMDNKQPLCTVKII